MICPNCKSILPENALSCSKCGTVIVQDGNYRQLCENCKKPVAEGQRYCRECSLRQTRKRRSFLIPLLFFCASAAVIVGSLIIRFYGRGADNSSHTDSHLEVTIIPDSITDESESVSSSSLSSTEDSSISSVVLEEEIVDPPFYPPDSPLAKPGFISFAESGLQDHVMSWNDDGLEEFMEEITGKDGDSIMLSDVFDLREFTMMKMHSDRAIHDITALRELRNIEVLNLNFNHIVNISPLQNMPNLRQLWIRRNEVTNLSPLYGLTMLERIDVSRNPLSNVFQLVQLPGLRRVTVCWAGLTDENFPAFLDALAEHGGITKLDVSGNQITDFSHLASLQDLTELYVEKIGMDDEMLADLCRAIRKNTKLERLTLQGNRITDVSPLSGLNQLEYVNIANNQVKDLSPLLGIRDLKEIALKGNEGINTDVLEGHEIELSGNVSYQDAG